MEIKALLFSLLLNTEATHEVLDTLAWKDLKGDHIAIVNKLSYGKRWTENWKSSIEVVFYNLDRNGAKTKEWSTVEKADNYFSSSEYVPNSLQSVDLDGDKINELIFIVDISPEGSDPSISKLILYSSSSKKIFKVEGIMPKNWGDIYRYKINIDKSFLDSPSDNLTRFCIEIWEKYFSGIRKSW